MSHAHQHALEATPLTAVAFLASAAERLSEAMEQEARKLGALAEPYLELSEERAGGEPVLTLSVAWGDLPAHTAQAPLPTTRSALWWVVASRELNTSLQARGGIFVEWSSEAGFQATLFRYLTRLKLTVNA